MKTAAAILSGILFLAAVARFAPGWIKWFRKGEDPEILPREKVTRAEDARVLLLFLATLVLHLLLVAVVRLAAGKNSTFMGTFGIWKNLDSAHYMDVARYGYPSVTEGSQELNMVFLPGYPVLAGILMMVIPDEAVCGYLAAWLPFLASGPVLLRLLRLDMGKGKAFRVLTWFCLFPGAVFFAYPLSEPLFLLAAAASLYGARTRRWFQAGVWGFVAAFTRSLGLLMLAPLGMEWIRGLRSRPGKARLTGGDLRDFACMLLVPFGTTVYLYMNFVSKGDPLIFLEYQQSNWHQHLDWFFSTAAVQTEYAVRTWSEERIKFWGLWLPNLLVGFASLGLMTAAAKRIRPSYTAWFICYFAVSYGASWLLSGPRYMTVFFPLAAAVEELPGPKWLKWPKGCLLGAAAAAYTVFFALRWGVW